MSEYFNPERLRPWDLTMLPDPRTEEFVKRLENGDFGPIEIQDYYASLEPLELNSDTPQDVKNYYETARNLYLYAWHIYRFFPVAEQQALFCIEFALRERVKNNEDAPKHLTLKKLLKYAQRKKLIRNEGFSVWHNRPEFMAIERYRVQQRNKLIEEGLDEIKMDYSEIEIKQEDSEYDYISILVETLPKIRNDYAHGTSMLHNQSLVTLRTACELVNQLYS